MRVAVDEEARREISGAFDVEYVGLALGRFGLSCVSERKRIRTERRREHAECQPREILFHRGRRIRRWSCWCLASLSPCRATCRSRRRKSTRTRRRSSSSRPTGAVARLNQSITVEAATARPALARRNLVCADVLVGKLDRD